MIRLERWKVVLILLACLLGMSYAVPNVLSPQARAWIETNLPGITPSKTVNLGLDLQGGSYLLLEVDTQAVIVERTHAMVDAARAALRKEEIGYLDLGSVRNGIAFKLRDADKDRDAAYKIARELEQGTQIDISGGGDARVTLTDAGLAEITTQVIGQSIEIVRRRVDESGTKEPIIHRQGESRIVVELPGVNDPEEVKQLLGKTAKLSFRLMDATASGDRPGPGGERLPMREHPGASLSVSKRPVITGDMLVDSQASFEQNAPVVTFRFNPIGAKKFCDTTRANVGKPFAIVLDGEIISAPVIRDAICGGSGIISGSFTVKEVADLSLLLRAGALPAPLKIVEERSVGPTLGADSVAAGRKACVMALIFVAALSVVVYALFGVFAATALLVNMVMLVGIMSVLQATLTLPGIAGIVLTIGLAIDANVLIYERIKEELRAGRSILSAIDTGYSRARTTIFDSNMTALISALILFSFGTGPIKGFAVTMCVGVVTSYFCAMMLTRLMVLTWLKWKKPQVIEA